jgi:polar amino acid transport system substrate-binding protein
VHKLFGVSALVGALALACSAAFAADVPAAGKSPRIDAIKKAGVLRVGVLANPPWLVENTTGSGDQWTGPAWLLAKEVADKLGVTVQPVPVSHETKVPVLAANQVDMTISPLAETPERQKVVDFVIYSNTASCMFGQAKNEKFASAANVDALNDPKITIAYFIGGSEENWVKQRFPKAHLRGVTSSNAPAPIEEVMARRADAAPINRIQWELLKSKVPGLAVLPKENDCQESQELAAPVGLAIDKNQQVYLDWLRSVQADMKSTLVEDEKRQVDAMKK